MEDTSCPIDKCLRFKKDTWEYCKYHAKRKLIENNSCLIDGCANQYFAKGLCFKHHKAFPEKRLPHLSHALPNCKLEGCDGKYYASGYCCKHYAYVRYDVDKQSVERGRLSGYGYRLYLINLLGGECIKCGFRDLRALHLDHINGGGNKERKRDSGRLHRYYYKNPDLAIRKLQVLCANCNWIKRYEDDELKKVVR